MEEFIIIDLPGQPDTYKDFESAWEASPLDTIKLIFLFRQVSEENYNQGIRWLAKKSPADLVANFRLLRLQDMLRIWEHGNELCRAFTVYAFAERLKQDLFQMSRDLPVTDAAKFAPTDDNLVIVICEQLDWSSSVYQQSISKLREKIVSNPPSPITDRRILKLDTPKACLQLLHSPDISSGWEIQEIMAGLLDKPTPFLEQHLHNHIARYRISGRGRIFQNTFCVCDTSLSMTPVAKSVAYALTMLIAEVSGQNRALTFSKHPQWINLQGTITERIEKLKNASWGYSTNFVEILNVIEEKPRILYIFTDMPIERADPNKLWRQHCHKPDKIVYWDLSGWSSLVLSAEDLESSLIVLNGYSSSVMKQLLHTGDIFPWVLLHSILDSHAYNNVKLCKKFT